MATTGAPATFAEVVVWRKPPTATVPPGEKKEEKERKEKHFYRQLKQERKQGMGGEATTKKGHCKTSGAVGSKREQSVGKDCVDGRVVAVASFITGRTRAICGLGSLAFEGHEKMVWSTVPRYFNFISDRMDGYKLLFSFSGGRLSAGTFPALASLRALQVDITAVVRALSSKRYKYACHV